MRSGTSLRKAIFPYLESYDFIIGATGIRYGSVAYIAFGQGVLKQHRGRASTIQYPIELEIGSNEWRLVKEGKNLIDSQFDDPGKARERLEELLVGKKITDIDLSNEESRILFDGGLALYSRVSPEPASGFLYSFHVDKGPSWETIDGESMQV